MIRVVLADDHPIVLAGLEQLLAAQPDFRIERSVPSGREAIAAVRELHPDILVLDLRMADGSGLDVVRELGDLGSATRIIVLTATESDEVLEAIRLGVPGVVLKDMPPSLLLQCIRAVHRGDKWIERGLAARALDRALAEDPPATGPAARLTPREREVARLIGEGMSNKAVGTLLGITEGTVKLHLHHVYEKLGLQGRMALARYLQRHPV